jgi:hypothetical protein
MVMDTSMNRKDNGNGYMNEKSELLFLRKCNLEDES